jgi:hypothetical protein
MDSKFSDYTDINRFLPADKKILDALYEETPVVYKSQEDFFNLPVNEEYKKNQEKKKLEIENIKPEEDNITIELKEN